MTASGAVPPLTSSPPSAKNWIFPDHGFRCLNAHAQVIVTSNLRDFPGDLLAVWHMEARSPDDFVLDQIELDDRIVWACLQQIVDSRVNPPETIEDVLTALERAGLVESVAALRTRPGR